MAELFTLRPLAPGNNENDQLHKFCSILGTPKPSVWPEGYKLAAAMDYRFPSYSGNQLADFVAGASSDAIELMRALLQWDPQKRPTAAESLKFSFFEIKEDQRQPEGSVVRNSSKWSHGSSRITGNSSKGKWSFRAGNSSKDFVLPQLKDSTDFRPLKVKPEPIKNPQLPCLNKKTPSRQISRERLMYNKNEIKSPLRAVPKFATNKLISPRHLIKLPPLCSLGSTGNAIIKQPNRLKLLGNS